MGFKDYQVAVEKYLKIVGEDAEYISKRLAWQIYKLVEPRFSELDYALDVRVTDSIVDEFAKKDPNYDWSFPNERKGDLYPILHQGLVGSAYYSSSASSTPSVCLAYYLLPRTSTGWYILKRTIYQDYVIKEQDGLATDTGRVEGSRSAA